MDWLLGRLVKLETGHDVLINNVSVKNVIPECDWVASGRVPPDAEERIVWDGGKPVVGYDVEVMFEDGTVMQGWVADADWLIKFYDVEAARKRIGVYSAVFSPQAYMKDDGTPGVPVGLLYLPEEDDE